MSEKPAQMNVRPRAQNASETPLTPAQRAEREIAELDRGMQSVMETKDNQAALVNPPGNALQPPDGRTVTPGVSEGANPDGMMQMVLNFVIPGAGTIMRGVYGTGFVQLGMALAALPTMLLVKWWLGILLGVFAWVWSAAMGIGFFTRSTRK